MPTDLLAADRLLDGPAADDLLADVVRRSGGQLHRARLRSVHHRGGRSLSRVFDVTIEAQDTVRDVLLVLHVDARRPPPEAPLLHVEGVPVSVWRFPRDPYLPGLPSAVHRGRVRELLDALGAPPGSVRLRTRAYRPTRRAVVEVTIDGSGPARGIGRVLYLKVLEPRRAGELADTHRQLVSQVPVPRVIGVGADQGIVALEALAGQRLRDAVVSGAALPDPWELVALTDRFATCDLDAKQDPRRFADATRHVGLLSRLVPEAAERVARVARHTRSLHGPLRAVHGDLHDGQLLVVDATVSGLIDVDGAGPGLIAEDAGRLVAHLQVLADLHPGAAERITAYADAVARAFAQSVGDQELAWGTAAAWLGLATGPHRAQDPGWAASTRRRIERAEQALTPWW